MEEEEEGQQAMFATAAAAAATAANQTSANDSLFKSAFKKISNPTFFMRHRSSSTAKIAIVRIGGSDDPKAINGSKLKGAQLPPVWQEAPPAPSAKPSTGLLSESSPSTSSLTDGTQSEESITPRSTLRVPAPNVNGTNGNTRVNQYHALLTADYVDIDKLRELSWGGVPAVYRSLVWQLLLGYLPNKRDRHGAMLSRKRQEYRRYVTQYYDVPDDDRSRDNQKTLRQILVDIPRTAPEEPLFKYPVIQQSMERILYIWSIRHPASGYVQGINDLLTPFIVAFLAAHDDNPQRFDVSTLAKGVIESVEADSYWCLTKLLDGIQDHYTFSQPGLQRMVFKMEELIHRCDVTLHHHLVEKEELQFVQFAFRWMNCLLMREVPLSVILRLWDTYLSEDGGFERFHVYVCAAILMTFGEKLKTLSFQDLIMFLQALPTREWTEHDIEPLLSRAFILKSYFDDAPNHLAN